MQSTRSAVLLRNQHEVVCNWYTKPAKDPVNYKMGQVTCEESLAMVAFLPGLNYSTAPWKPASQPKHSFFVYSKKKKIQWAFSVILLCCASEILSLRRYQRLVVQSRISSYPDNFLINPEFAPWPFNSLENSDTIVGRAIAHCTHVVGWDKVFFFKIKSHI